MKTHQSTIGKNDEWITPIEILNKLGEFDLDPCSPIIRPFPTAKQHYTINDNGLAMEWYGRVWCNPPFNRRVRPQWMCKCSEHDNCIMLIPAATETKAFFKYVWERADSITFIEGRPHFYYVDGNRAPFNCGAALCLVGYGKNNTEIMDKSGLGKTIRLR
jgi:hypothetical protein